MTDISGKMVTLKSIDSKSISGIKDARGISLEGATIVLNLILEFVNSDPEISVKYGTWLKERIRHMEMAN